MRNNLDKRSEAIKRRIQDATDMFDQKVNDKIIDIHIVQDDVEAIKQLIVKRFIDTEITNKTLDETVASEI